MSLLSKASGFQPGLGSQRNISDIYNPDAKLEPLKYSTGEVSVGGITYIRGKQYQVVKAEKKANCNGCYFYKDKVCHKDTNRCPCLAYSRADKTWVVFKEIENGPFK